jgi:methionyl-tRNA synthetase
LPGGIEEKARLSQLPKPPHSENHVRFRPAKLRQGDGQFRRRRQFQLRELRRRQLRHLSLNPIKQGSPRMGKFYLTTPIYYVNDAPHIGTAYCTIAADTIARYQRLKGNRVLFATGTDENGLKVAEAGQARGLTPQAFVDEMAALFESTWRKLDISFDRFIRTTEDAHKRAVQALMKKLYDQGDIYESTYEGWYCLSDETFFRENELVEGRCPNPECRKEVEWLGEKGFFFRLSKYAEPLLSYIESHPDFLLPETRKNEVISFIKGGLKDACISRLADWGTPLPQEIPGAEGMVVYVWLDALVNYLTVVGYPDDEKSLAEFWPADFHLVGKEIFVRFHATLWPAMLMSAGLAVPKTVFGHGWLTVNGEKMSKSKGNVIAPLQLLEQVQEKSGCRREMALDAIRYYLLRDISFGMDGDCSLDAVLGRFNADLANDLGNLLNRLLPLIIRHNEGKIPVPAEDEAVTAAAKEAVAGWEAGMDKYDFSSALRSVWGYLSFLNRWIDSQAPWSLAKQGKKAELDKVFYCLAESLRIVTMLITPVMPSTAAAIQKQLGLPETTAALGWPEAITWGQLPGGTQVSVGEPLFPRVQKPK